MVNFLLKKSYRLKDLKEIDFKDLWGDHGIFTTMWIFGKPPKILFFKKHIFNLLKSLKKYNIIKKSIKKDILSLLNKNLSKEKNYNHLLRVALNKNIISISLRKRLVPKLNFNLKLVNLKRNRPQFKNLKYKKILSYLSKMDNSKSDIGLVFKKKLHETGTSNLLFIRNDKIYTPKKDYYEGITYKFFKSRVKKIFKEEIFVNELEKFDEILLIGSGKGVTSVKTIKQIGWRRKKLKQYKVFSKYYNSAINNCNSYKFK
tara:strand:- start:1204 stop:1980 length:777 start_codon:yes stop_codon:yes gene_type:complete